MEDPKKQHQADATARGFARFGLVGRSPSFCAALQLIAKIAACDATALIQGETGTGKELAARAIHYLGSRASYPFLPINCGALPDNLIVNELFGHARGAYTDARDGNAGLIADARGGTLFLDEVETLSLRAQVAMLRFLQDGVYRPLGGKSDLCADVRIVAASNADLRALSRGGRFRSDLFYRLDVMPVWMPPLRARGDDVVLLADHFLERLTHQYGGVPPTLGPESIAALRSHGWPGNVRELENLMHRSYLFMESQVIRPELTLDSASPSPMWERDGAIPGLASLALDKGLTRAKAALVGAFERSVLLRAMEESQGNISAAARRCGKERRSFGKLLKKHGIEKGSYL